MAGRGYLRDSSSVEAAEVSKGSSGAIRFRDHAERTGPRRIGLAYNPCFLHLEELGLGGG